MEGRSGKCAPGVHVLVFRLAALGHLPRAELAAVATLPLFRRQLLENFVPFVPDLLAAGEKVVKKFCFDLT